MNRAEQEFAMLVVGRRPDESVFVYVRTALPDGSTIDRKIATITVLDSRTRIGLSGIQNIIFRREEMAVIDSYWADGKEVTREQAKALTGEIIGLIGNQKVLLTAEEI
jgi:hypothetical protein